MVLKDPNAFVSINNAVQLDILTTTVESHDSRLAILQACIKNFERDLLSLKIQLRQSQRENSALGTTVREAKEFIKERVTELRAQGREDDAIDMLAVLLSLDTVTTSKGS